MPDPITEQPKPLDLQAAAENPEVLLETPVVDDPTRIRAAEAIGFGEDDKGILEWQMGRAREKGPKEPLGDPRVLLKPKEEEPEPEEEPKEEEPKAEDPAPEPKKVKVGDREFTEEELAALLAKAEPKEPEKKEEPPKFKFEDETPSPDDKKEEPKGPSEEEIQAREAEYLRQLRSKAEQHLTVPEDTMETILAGGKEGAKAVVTLLSEAVARTQMETRKSVFQDLEPVLQNIASRIEPLSAANQDLERYAVEQTFVARHPEYQQAGRMDMARAVAENLIQRYPKQVQKMSREQFVDAVDHYAGQMIQQEFKSWNPDGDWKEAVRARMNPPKQEAPKEPEKPAAPEPEKKVERVTPNKPKTRPPSAASPGSLSAISGSTDHAKIASTLLE